MNESAEEGIAFFSNLLGLAFGKSNGTEPADDEEDEVTPDPLKTTILTSESTTPVTASKQQRKSKQINNFRPNDI